MQHASVVLLKCDNEEFYQRVKSQRSFRLATFTNGAKLDGYKLFVGDRAFRGRQGYLVQHKVGTQKYWLRPASSRAQTRPSTRVHPRYEQVRCTHFSNE